MKKTILSLLCILILTAGLAYAVIIARSVYQNGIEDQKLLIICASLAVSAFGADQLAKLNIPRKEKKIQDPE